MKKIMFNDRFGLTKAVLEGRKTQTRRIATEPNQTLMDVRRQILVLVHKIKDKEKIGKDLTEMGSDYSSYKVGDVVAIAQSYKDCGIFNDKEHMKLSSGWSNKMFVRADLMPHHIKIEQVRVERLQDIYDEDCIEEGIYRISEGRYKVDGLKFIGYDPKTVYAELIGKIYGKETWRINPFVFVYDFKLID